MKLIFSAALVAMCPAVAAAQSSTWSPAVTPSFGPADRGVSTDFSSGVEPIWLVVDGATPTTARYRRERVRAIRDEISAIVAKSDGELSQNDRRTIQRKIRAYVEKSGPFPLGG
ncbi:hypothetical protein [Sphingomonas sp.]